MQRIFLIAVALVLLTGCSGKNQKKEQKKENEITLYYLNPEGTRLVEYSEELENQSEDLKGKVFEVIKKLKESPELSEYRTVITKEMGFQKITVQNGYVSLDFSLGYGKLDPTLEILCRAAIVKSVTQIPLINNVELTMNGQPLMDRDGQVVGIMNEESFTDQDSTLVSYSMYGETSLYFSNSSGKKLVEYATQLAVSNNIPIEQVVMEQLIEGPIEKGMIKTVPAETKVIKTSVKDGVCYVDFNKKFLDGVEGIKDEVILYSIVNSLVELPTVNQVQFTIEGERMAKYRETIPFDGFFERRLDLVEGQH